MKTYRSIWFSLLILGSAAAAFAGDSRIEWRPVTPAELQMKAPFVEPDADAEAIFWDTWIDNGDPEKLILLHYVRVKVFTDRGRERYSKFDVPYFQGLKIKDLEARVIRPDGSIIEIGKDDIFER